jgi:hypothetical protein
MAKIISMLDHLVRGKTAEFEAVKAALARPIPTHRSTDKLTADEWASWFIQGLWQQGFQIVPIEEDDSAQ